MTPFTINSATESDVPILLAMIRELAEFERLAHEVEVTADSLRAALFGERPVAAALLARVDGCRPVTRFITRHFPPSSAGQEFSSTIFMSARNFANAASVARCWNALPQWTPKLGGGRFEWIALRWNENAFRFYRSLGAKVMDEWALLRMNSREISNLVSAKVKVAA